MLSKAFGRWLTEDNGKPRENDPAVDSPSPGVVGDGRSPMVETLDIPAALSPLRAIADYVRRIFSLLESQIGRNTYYRTWAKSLAVGQGYTFAVDVDIAHWHAYALGAQTDRWRFSLGDEAGVESPAMDGRSFLQAPGHTRKLTIFNVSGSTLTFYVIAESGVEFSVGQL